MSIKRWVKMDKNIPIIGPFMHGENARGNLLLDQNYLQYPGYYKDFVNLQNDDNVGIILIAIIDGAGRLCEKYNKNNTIYVFIVKNK